MKRSALLTTLSLAGALLLAGGCEEETRCREACIHACEICGGDCDPSDPNVAQDLDACETECIQNRIGPSRAECVLETLECDELWKC
jgi:hypothetical protein